MGTAMRERSLAMSIQVTTHKQRSERLYSRQRAAKLLDISFRTLQRWERNGMIQTVRLSERLIKVRESEIERIRSGRAINSAA